MADPRTVTVTIEVSAQRIADLMTTAVECNDMTTAWCAGVYWNTKGSDPPPGPWYAEAQTWAGEDFQIEVHEIIDEGRPPVDDNIKIHRCTKADFAAGLKLMSEKYGHHFGDFMAENEDAVTADVFLQCVALREVVYG